MRCGNCQEKFTPRREWQLFCSNKCKTQHHREHKGFCFYCGEQGNHRDHVHPVSVRGGQRRFMGQETVYACVECNSSLSNNLFDDIIQRLEFLVKTYEWKYKSVLRQIQWDEEELAELGYSLRIAIKKSLRDRVLMEQRMKHLYNVKIKLYKLFQDNELEDLTEEEGKTNVRWG